MAFLAADPQHDPPHQQQRPRNSTKASKRVAPGCSEHLLTQGRIKELSFSFKG
jgi:hypothetical protein